MKSRKIAGRAFVVITGYVPDLVRKRWHVRADMDARMDCAFCIQWDTPAKWKTIAFQDFVVRTGIAPGHAVMKRPVQKRTHVEPMGCA